MTVSSVTWAEARQMTRSERAAFIDVYIDQNPSGDGGRGVDDGVDDDSDG